MLLVPRVPFSVGSIFVANQPFFEFFFLAGDFFAVDFADAVELALVDFFSPKAAAQLFAYF